MDQSDGQQWYADDFKCRIRCEQSSQQQFVESLILQIEFFESQRLVVQSFVQLLIRQVIKQLVRQIVEQRFFGQFKLPISSTGGIRFGEC